MVVEYTELGRLGVKHSDDMSSGREVSSLVDVMDEGVKVFADVGDGGQLFDCDSPN